MGSSEFTARIDELKARVGDGVYTGRVIVDQVYAAPLERGFWETGPLAGHTNHPRHGGETHFLAHALGNRSREYLQQIADQCLDVDGIYKALVDDVEQVAGQVAVLAPVEFGDLRRSAHPTVEHNGQVTYDRAPAVERLTRSELEAKSDLLERAHDTRSRAGHPWGTH